MSVGGAGRAAMAPGRRLVLSTEGVMSTSNESKLAAAIDRLTAAVRQESAIAEANGKISKEIVEEMRAAREAADSRDFDAMSAVVELLSAVGSMATSASLKLLIADESSDSPPPSRRKKRGRAA